jgi:hypothetical protein
MTDGEHVSDRPISPRPVGLGRVVSILALLMIAACSSTPTPQAGAHITVTNLQFGPACGPAYAPITLCAQTNDIDVTGQGHCIYDRQPISCTWYGYSFDYTSPSGAASLDCDWSSDEPTTLGNPQGTQNHPVKSTHYRLPLPYRSGHIFNPQYAITGPHDAVQHVTQTCSYKREKLFEIEFRLRYSSQKDS